MEVNKGNGFELNFSNILQSLMVAGLIGMYVQFNQMKESDTIKGVQMLEMAKDMSDLKIEIKEITTELKEKPRFARDNFDQLISPIISNVNRNTAEISHRKGFMDDVLERLLILEIQLKINKNKNTKQYDD